MAAGDDARADALFVADLLPEPLRGHVAGSAGLHRDGAPAIAAAAHEHAVAKHRRSVKQRAEPAARPEFLARLRVERAHPFLESHHQFIAPAGFHEQRHAPRTDYAVGLPGEAVGAFPHRRLGRLHAPGFLARALVHRHEKRPRPRSEIQNAQIAVQHRRARVAPDVVLLSEIHMPQLLAREVPRIQPRRAEPRDHPLAIGRRRCRAKRVRLVRFLRRRPPGSGLPEHLAVLAIHAHQGALVARVLREEKAPAPDDRRRVPRLGQRDFPAHIFRRAPGQR